MQSVDPTYGNDWSRDHFVFEDGSRCIYMLQKYSYMGDQLFRNMSEMPFPECRKILV